MDTQDEYNQQMKVNGDGNPERLALFEQTDSELRYLLLRMNHDLSSVLTGFSY